MKNRLNGHQPSKRQPSQVLEERMRFADYAKAACRQILDNAARQKLPRPTIVFLLDDDCVEHGPFVFPTVPRKGEFIEPEWLGEGRDLDGVVYEVLGVEHCVPNDRLCEVPFLLLHVERNDHYVATIYNRERD